MNKNKVVVIILALIIVGLAGWLVYQNSANSTTNSESTANQSAEDSSAQSQRYLEIKELGIKLPLSDPAIQQISYTATAGYGDNKEVLSLTTSKIKDIACTNDSASSGTFKQDIYIFESEQSANEAQTGGATEIKKFNDRYFVYSEADMKPTGCELSSGDQKTWDEFRAATKNSFSSMSAL